MQLTKKEIRKAFVDAKCDWDKAAASFGIHHYTLRKRARALGITGELSEIRAELTARGELPNGRPRKPVPPKAKIVKAFKESGCNLADTAVALKVTAPTLRRWIDEDPNLKKNLESIRAVA